MGASEVLGGSFLSTWHNLPPVESQGEKPLQIEPSISLPTGARVNF